MKKREPARIGAYSPRGGIEKGGTQLDAIEKKVGGTNLAGHLKKEKEVPHKSTRCMMGSLVSDRIGVGGRLGDGGKDESGIKGL